MFHNPNWTAARGTENWRDETVLRATAWLRSFVSAKEMDRRLEIAREYLLAARGQWELGVMPPLYDPVDTIAWYIPQAETFAIDRQLWVPGETARIVPFLARIGEELDRVREIGGVEIRAERLMRYDKRQPDGGIFEILVALAYRRRGWTTVEFIPERPGVGRTPDIHVARPRTRWAVECKRLMPSTYAAREKNSGKALRDRSMHYA